MCAAGEREEHVVQRGLADLDVVHQHPACVQRPHQSSRQAGRAVHAGAQAPPVVADWTRPRHQRRDHRRTASGSGVGQGHLDVRAPARLLQLARRPVGDHLAVVDDDDAVGQRVGLVQVLRREQHA